MKISELLESDQFVMEMANFLADVTDLPANIVLWTRTQPDELPHDKYRVKVFKNRIHCCTFSISIKPVKVWETSTSKLKLDSYEYSESVEVISSYASLFIQYVDGKITADDLKYEIKKSR